jgi:hypothetical protein
VTGTSAKITAIAHFKKSANHLLIASEDNLVQYDMQKQTIVETLISKKKSNIKIIVIHVICIPD